MASSYAGLPPVAPLLRDQSLPAYLDASHQSYMARNKAWNRVASSHQSDVQSHHEYPLYSPSTRQIPDSTPEDVRSRPINDFDSDAGSDVYGTSAPSHLPHSPTSSLVHPVPPFSQQAQSSMQAVAQQHLAHCASAPAPLHMHRREHSMSGRESNGTLALAPPVGTLSAVDAHTRPSMDRASAAKFRTDIMLARTGSNAMDRYKALTRLLSSVKREMVTSGIDQPFRPSSWTVAHHDLLCKIIEIGEALSGFGTADFGERSNSSRAINTKDYAYLLKLYGETYWGLFRHEFIEGMPQSMQDEMWTVRGLLTVRFEANAIIHDQLMKHVGLEQTGGGGAVVYNTSVVSANPVNKLDSKPHNVVNAHAKSASKAIQNSTNKLGMMALASVAGLWLAKRVGILGMVPGLGRFKNRSHDDDPLSDDGAPRARRGGRRQRLGHDERLLLAFDHVDRSYKELSKAQRNIELLKNDWRLGPLRLSAPFGGPDPPGYEPVEVAQCEPRQFMHAQLGYR